MMMMTVRDISKIPLCGGHGVLDLVNTVDGRLTDHSHDYLRTPEDLVTWLGRTGSLPQQQFEVATAAIRSNPGKAQELLVRLTSIRELFNDLLAAYCRGNEPDTATLQGLQSLMSDAFQSVVIEDMAQVPVQLRFGDNFFQHFPRLIVFLSLKLLTTEQRDRLKVCERDGCGWFFLDNSRRKNRRWCSMKECGNVLKQRRYRKSQRRAAAI